MKIGSRNISIFRVAFTFGLLCFVWCKAYAQTFVVSPIETRLEKGRHYLVIEVKNCSRSDVVIPLSDLPWGQHKLGLILYPAGRLASDPLQAITNASDFPDTPIQIKASGAVRGSVDLDTLFPDISRYDGQHNLLIFWAYDLSLLGGGKSRYVGGMFPFDNSVRTEGLNPPARECTRRDASHRAD